MLPVRVLRDKGRKGDVSSGWVVVMAIAAPTLDGASKDSEGGTKEICMHNSPEHSINETYILHET